MTWKIYAVMSGGGALAAYALSLAPTFAPATPLTSPQVAASAPAADIDIAALADGLSERVETTARFRAPSRDAFSFARVPVVPVPPAVETDLDLPEPAPEFHAPPFAVFGIMGDAGRRTAMLSSLTGVAFVAEGETVSGNWRVVEIAAASVTLESLLDGTQTTLPLFPSASP